MWIDRKVYTNLGLDNAKLRTECRVLAEQNRVFQSTLGWLSVRVTQLEKERAALLHTYMGIKVDVPEISIVPTVKEGHPLNQVPHFGDVGDAEAARLGITWNSDGTVYYADH